MRDTQTTLRRLLFLCTHNSARSQMAEGLLRGLGGGRFEVTRLAAFRSARDFLRARIERELLPESRGSGGEE